MNLDNIPSSMKQCPHWIVWKKEDRGGKKPTKTPYGVRGGYAKVNDPATWGTYEEAIQAQQGGAYSGVGFVFTDTPFIGVDIDGCFDPDTGEIDGKAIDTLQHLNSYTEYSQSGKGFHVVLEGKLPPGRRRNGMFEMYGDGSPRYFAMTGDLWGDMRDVRKDQTAIDSVHKKYIEPPEAAPPPTTAPGQSGTDVIAMLRRSKSGDKFNRLYNGDTSGYSSHSEADQALCNLLAFGCGRDAEQMDSIFRTSGLYREKWDKKHGRDTYGNITISKAIADCHEVYSPQDGRTAPRQEVKQPTEQWEPPIPFDAISTPEFPVESLPSPVAAFVEALAMSTQTPEEMGAVLSLGVLATAFQSRYEVEITPDWTEPLCLYSASIAPPGERKSAVYSALLAPVYRYEAERREFEAVDIAQNQTERALLEKALQDAQTRATKKKGSFEACKSEALELSAQLAQFEDKHPYRLLVDDTTSEKLIDIMDTQGGCITVASAEGGVFDAIAGRHEKGANFDVYLKGHAGDPILVDRVGRKANNVRQPRLTMMLTIQPEVLNGLMNNATFRGRGLCGRFLYAVCNSKVGNRDIDPETIPRQTKDEYGQFVRRILSGTDTGIIRLSAEAHTLRLEYAAHVEQRLGGEWEHMRDWGGKLVGAMLRIAALIHAAEAQGSPAETPISPEVLTAAVKIAEFLGVHAMSAYQVMGADETYEDAKHLWKRIKGTGQDEITKRDLWQLCKGKFKKVDAMEPSMQALIEMGYIREIETTTGERGRPSKKLLVNPTTNNIKNTNNTYII